MMRIWLSLVAIGMVASGMSGAAAAQGGRNIPAGSPLGNVPIVVPGTAGAATAAAAAADASQQAGEEAARAQQRAQAQAAARARAAAFDPPPPANPADEDPGRARPAATIGSNAEPARNRGPVPTPFGGGIRTPWNPRG